MEQFNKKNKMYNLYIDEKEYLNYEQDKKVSIGNTEISEKLLIDLFMREDYYLYTERILNDEFPELNIKNTKDNGVVGVIRLTKKNIYDALKLLKESSTISFNEKLMTIFNKLENSITYESFKEKYKDTIFQTRIDGKIYSVPFNTIIYYMEMNYSKLEAIFTNRSVKNIANMPKEYFVYMIYLFFLRNKIFDNYLIPYEMKIKKQALENQKLVDFESLNTFEQTLDINVSKVVINDELREYVLSQMPNDLNNLEKAIYIYIKLCRILTYDEEFYAFGQKGKVAVKHENLKHVSEISPSNNSVVCYEFNAIYGKFLSELGINFETEQSFVMDFGGSHAYLNFRCGKYLVRADSVTSIFFGDLVASKFGDSLDGLVCFNKNRHTQKEFTDIVDDVYEIVLREEKIDEFNSAIESLKLLCDIPFMSIEEKFSLLIKKVKKKGLFNMDILGNLIKNYKTIFSLSEQKKNVKLSLVRLTDNINEERDRILSVVFTINYIDYNNNEDNFYYLLETDGTCMEIDKNELQRRFVENEYFMVSDVYEIPGINLKGVTR